MNEVRVRAFFTLMLALCAACFVGIGTNYYVGFGVFLALWCIAGIVELNSD
jgi:sugar phosphate permease